jgi:hypothetical protein
MRELRPFAACPPMQQEEHKFVAAPDGLNGAGASPTGYGVQRKPTERRCTMKLSSQQIEQTVDQIAVEPIPGDHPAVPQLSRVYGDHTFFLDSEGLAIVEVADEPTETGTQMGQVVKIASWTDAKQTMLAPHEPELTDVVVELEPAEPGLDMK